jgi:dipeptidyl aminopeptidase/acylaminoacyl peptidase
MLSTCAQAFALKLQAFSVLPFQQTTDLVEKLPAQNVAFEELVIPDEIHDLLRWGDWVRAYRATAEFFDRKLAVSGKRQ